MTVLPLDQLFIWLTQTGFGLWIPPTISARFQGTVAESKGTDDLLRLFYLPPPGPTKNLGDMKNIAEGKNSETKTLLAKRSHVLLAVSSSFLSNGLHLTLPCILATAISASVQSSINHCGANVWEMCAVHSVPIVSPVSLFTFVFFPP